MADNNDMPAFGGVMPAEPAQKPTADEFFGAAGQKPTADEFFSKPARVLPGGLDAPGVGYVGEIPQSNEDVDRYVKNSSVGRVLNAFGSEAGDAWGPQTLPGLSDDTIKQLRQYGVFNKYDEGEKNLGKAMNEAFVRPAAAALDTFLRGSTAVFRGTQATVQQLGEEAGAPNFARDVAAIPEAFFGTPHPLGIPKTLPDIPKARSLGVIGEGEAGWKGTAEPDIAARQAAETEAVKAQAEAEAKQAEANQGAAAPAEVAPAPAPDIHAVARQVAPETFQKFDALQQRKDTFRRWIDELSETRDRQVEADAPHADEIAALQEKMQDATPRLQKKYQARLDELQTERDAFIDERTQGDSPDMAKIRQKLMETDYAMRDLAPDVGKAYRAAEEQMPKSAEAAAVPTDRATIEPVPAAETSAIAPTRRGATLLPDEAQTAPAATPESARLVETANADPELPVAPPEAVAKPQVTTPEQVKSISQDVAKKLVAAGRPQEEAEAAGKLIASHYWARAARFNGEKGTGLDLYNAEAPEIKAGRAKSRAKELAQTSRTGKISIAQDARNTITLFKDADASTFIHETGHQWLEELLRDAADERAPADVVKDAQTVREWLGAKDGEQITRAPHEKFARGFEAYMMEGRAPSSGLARVFEQFRQWLTSIYQTVAKLRAPINNDIRDVFDRLIVAKPERTVIAQDRGAAKDFADIHEADAEMTPPEGAHPAAELVQSERDRVAAEVSPEDENARLEGTPTEARSGEARNPQPDRNADAAGAVGGEAGAPAESGTVGASGSQTPAESPAARPEPKRVKGSPAAKEPRHQSLLELLSSIGGIRSGDALISDLRSIIGKDNKFVPGFGNLIRNGKGALSLDAAREAAVEAGYLEDEGRLTGRQSTSTIDHLLGAIDQELRGKKVYLAGEGGRAAVDPDEAAKREHYFDGKLDAALNDTGIAAADVSGAVRARVLEIMDKEGEHDPIAALERAWMEGDQNAVESGKLEPRPEPIPGWDVPDDAGADHAAVGSDVAVERPGDAATRDAGTRSGAGSSEAPKGAHERFDRSGSGLVDKAGNIRLDKLNTPDDINTVLKETAEENGDFLDARGVVPDAQVLALAEAAGVEATEIDMTKFAEQFGKGGLASKVVKLRQMLVQSASHVRDLAAKAAEGTDVDLMEFAEAKTRHQMIQGTLSAVTAEAGRALRAFRDMAGMKEATAISDLIRDTTHRTLFQLRQEAQGVLALETPAQVSKFVHDSAKPTFGDMILEYWINGLISGPATHTTYSVGNALLATWKAGPETAAAAAVGAVRRALGGEGERVMLGEVPAQAYGMLRGVRNGIVAAWEAVKTGKTTLLPGELESMSARQFANSPLVNPRASIPNFTVGGVPLPVGTLVRLPSRGIAAIHSFFRAMNYEREMSGLAYRQASMEGLEGQAFSQRIGEIETNPAPELMEKARASATDLTLMGKGGEITQALTRLTNARFAGGQWLKFIDPFVHISSNVIEQSIVRRTVLGVLSHEVRADLSGANGAVARDMAIARMSVGSALAVGIGSLAAEGLVNGSGPSDPKEKAIWTMVNGPPHSVRVGDTWYDIHRLGPLGMQVGIAADLYEVAHMVGKEDSAKIAHQLIHAFTQNIMDESFMRGPADLIKALTDPDRYGPSYIRNFLSSFVPFSVGMYQVSRAVDPYSRSARTTMDAVKAKIPWLSETLLPRVDVFGNSVASRDALGVAGLSAIYEQKVNNDPVPQAMLKLGVFPAMPERKIRGVELTDQQYFDYSTVAGHMAKQRLDMIVQMPGFSALPETVQRDMVANAIKTSRESARSMIMMQNPDIVRQATDNKMQLLKGVLPKKH